MIIACMTSSVELALAVVITAMLATPFAWLAVYFLRQAEVAYQLSHTGEKFER